MSLFYNYTIWCCLWLFGELWWRVSSFMAITAKSKQHISRYNFSSLTIVRLVCDGLFYKHRWELFLLLNIYDLLSYLVLLALFKRLQNLQLLSTVKDFVRVDCWETFEFQETWESLQSHSYTLSREGSEVLVSFICELKMISV